MEAIIDNLNLPVSKTWQSGVLAEFEFDKYQKDAEEWKKKADELVITDASQLQEMKLADEGRKVLQKIRTSIEKKRKELKERSLQEGRSIDAIAKALTALVEPIERTLEEKAKYAENLEKQRIQKLHDERLAEISPYLDAIPVGVNFGALDLGSYNGMLHYAKAEFEERKAKEEAERIAAEEAERKRMIYTDRRIAIAPYLEYGFFDLHIDTTEEEFQQYLQAGKDAKKVEDEHRQEQARIAAELAAEKQRELDQLQLQHQREKSLLSVDFDPSGIDLLELTQEEFDNLYTEKFFVYNQKKEEQKRHLEELARLEEEERKAQNAPDLEKLASLSNAFRQFALPSCSTEDGQKVVADVRALLDKVSAFIDSKVEKIR